jgi:hypothetical protein
LVPEVCPAALRPNSALRFRGMRVEVRHEGEGAPGNKRHLQKLVSAFDDSFGFWVVGLHVHDLRRQRATERSDTVGEFVAPPNTASSSQIKRRGTA